MLSSVAAVILACNEQSDGATPLDTASGYGRVGIVRMLLEFGADVNAVRTVSSNWHRVALCMPDSESI